MDRNKINILIANEEWLQHHKLLVLKEFDKIITKSSFAKQLLSPYNNNIVNCGFITKDRYIPSTQKQEKFLHVMGKSSQKGSEHVLTSFTSTCNHLPLTVIESREGCTFENLGVNSNFNYIKDFVSEDSLNIANAVCERSLENVENPRTPDREQWINDLCYAEWSLKECEEGEPWRHLRTYIHE